MGRTENVIIFEDTEKLCKTNERFKESVKKSTETQRLYLESDTVPKQKKDLYEEKAKIVVSRKRTLEAAEGYKGNSIAVLNFASASNPGGGVVRGSTAQEECICRCTGLFFSLNTPAMWEEFYKPNRNAHNPIHKDDIIYTPGVTVFKTDTTEPKLMDEKDWYDIDVISCAAPNLRAKPGNVYNTGDGRNQIMLKDSELLAIHEKRLRRILEIAILNRRDTIILGAFGCGAFENNPEVVALANRNVIKEYLNAFKNIEYAVYSSSRDERNYKIFDRVLGGLCG